MSQQSLHILHTESSCGWGGQEIRILTEAKGMLDRGHRVTLVCCPNSNIYREAAEYGITVVPLPIEKKKLSSLLAMRSWLKSQRGQFDIINTHSSTDAWLVAVACATLSGMPPVVRTRHVSTDINKGFPTRWLYLKATRHIATTGEKLRQQLHRENGFPLEHMTSVATGIDLARYKPANKAQACELLGLENRPYVGIVATMRSWKGHSYLLQCWETLSQEFPEWRLLLVGDGPQRQALEQQATASGIAGSVVFMGNRRDVPDCLNAMDLFVLPSYGNEGVPQGIMQAMACGLPVISTTVGAITEAVIDQQTGFIIEPQNNTLLSAKLRELMSDPELRTSMGDASLARAQQHFGSDVMLDKMETIFHSAMDKQ